MANDERDLTPATAPGDEPAPGEADASFSDPAADVRQDEQHIRAIARERRARVAKVVVALIIAVLLAIFIATNAHPVPVNFVFTTKHPLLIWVMFACALLGGILGYMVGRPGKGLRFHRGDRSDAEDGR